MAASQPPGGRASLGQTTWSLPVSGKSLFSPTDWVLIPEAVGRGRRRMQERPAEGWRLAGAVTKRMARGAPALMW